MDGFCKTSIKFISLVLRQKSQISMAHDFMHKVIKARKYILFTQLMSDCMPYIILYTKVVFILYTLQLLFYIATLIYQNSIVEIPLRTLHGIFF
jgi:hypothetical protein